MNTKKKILFIVTQSEFGGAQRFIYTFIEGLRRYKQIKPQQVGDTQINAEKGDFLYPDITYKIRGACFKVWRQFRGAFKEKIIERALAKELENQGLKIDIQKQISVLYKNEKMGTYVPDIIINDKVLIELKNKTVLTKEDEKQFWLYLKGSEYRLGLLINFGRKLEIKRKVYDIARDESASISVLPKAQNQRLSAIDYEVVVGAGPEGDDNNGLLKALERKGIDTKHLKYLRRGVNPFFDFFLGLVEIYNLIKKEKPDILFLCSSKAGAMGSLAAHLYRRYTQIKLRRKVGDTRINAEIYQRGSAYSEGYNQRVSAKLPKVIYRIGGWAFNDPNPFLLRAYYKFIEKFSAKWKDIIVNNAESDKQQAIKLGIKPKDRILTIYNGINIDEMKFFSKEEAKNLLRIKGRFIIGTIANLYPSKGIKYLIEAAKTIDTEFVIIGEGKKKKQGNVSFIGFIPEAYKYLKAFDVFVLPSVKEGFPWTILEAMAAGIPVIATKVGAIPEIIKHGESGILVKPRNPKELADAIKKLLKDKDLRERVVKKAKKVVEEKFNLSQMVKKYEDLFSFS